MQEIASETTDHNFYYTLADQSPHALHRMGTRRMLSDVCLYSFFCKHVVFAASHVFESQHTRKLLRDYPELLQSGAVVVDLRDDCRDFRDFVDCKREQRQEERHWRHPSKIELAKHIEANSKYVISWSHQSELEHLRSTLIETLRNSESTLRMRLAGVHSATIADLTTRVAEMDNIKRVTLFRVADEILGEGSELLKREVNAAYYASGAINKNLHPALAPVYFEAVTQDAVSLSERSGGLVHQDVFEAAATALNLDIAPLCEYPELLLVLREKCCKELDGFRSAWWNRVLQGSDSLPSAGTVRNLVYDELARESKRKRRRLWTGRGVGIAGCVVSGLALIPMLGLSALSLALSVVSLTVGEAVVVL